MTKLKELMGKQEYNKFLNECLDRNELGDAELFAKLFANIFCFDHAEGNWYIFQNQYWELDKTGRVNIAVATSVAEEYQSKAKALLFVANKVGGDRATNLRERAKLFENRARKLRSRIGIRNILQLASNLRSIGLTGDEWNVHVLCLPVANGIVDLKTGNIRQGRPEDYINSFAPVDWQDLECPAPNFENFMSEMFGGIEELIAFVQRLLGYAISGDTREQILPIFWGEGANGKSTLMDILSQVLGGGFCFTTQSDSLMDMRKPDGDSPRPFVCALRNKRVVWASESQDGQRLNAGLVKQLTGDGNITARNLYSKPITFKPSHTIFLVTNQSPHIPDARDYAMIRRLIFVPFGVQFVDEPTEPNQHKLDKTIFSKMKDEGPGILAWLVRGCMEWQEQGLNPPEIVKLATAKYRESEDIVGRYIAERFQIGDQYKAPAGKLYADYAQWCEDCGYNPVSKISFGKRITKDFGESKSEWINGRTQKVYHGIGLLDLENNTT